MKSNGLDQYQDRYVVSDINAVSNTIEFSNGTVLTVGEAMGDVSEETLRRIQIREAIAAHFDKEQALFQKGVKVLSLFFIDEVVKYRDYSKKTKRVLMLVFFEEEYEQYFSEIIKSAEPKYSKYLQEISSEATHCGYFFY